jgi:hypothetical protein
MNPAQLAAYYNEYTQAYESGQCTKEEYINLLQGLDVEQTIASTAEELQFKEQLNVAINAAISIASAVA